MGFRFRKSIKLFPGVRLNLSKSGVSTTIGRPGASMNIRGRRVRGTVGIPGSGMSYDAETTIGGDDHLPTPPRELTPPPRRSLGMRLIGALLGR